MVVNRGLTMFWFLIFFWIVRVGSVPIKNFKNTIAIDKDSSTSMGIQHRKGHWVEPPETVQEISGIEQAVVEGDLLLSDERLAVDSLWPPIDGITSIPYKLSDSLTERKQTILAGFKMISDPTCIHFHEYTNEQNYLNIIPGKGCASYVGFQGGAQNVFFDSSCSSGNLCHEIMHALGLHHEHTRPDRDSFITIQWEAVVPEKKSNFMIKQGNTQGLAYDTESIMHYGNSYFSANGNPTIIPKDKGVDMGQRTHLSPLDIIRLNKLYHCGESE
ncbi:low choriolytic enzyme [Esox lucius]|uniref:low choriolytic enzyme n=1 Tax=Esox lucius TaxID=8010 RepID=UPI001476821E|nr:low choriolytic enzyme [Esox lucius]